MARSFRSSALVYAALLSTATVALFVGCAESTDSDVAGDTPDSSTEAGKKDARAGDDSSSTEDEDEDSGSNVKKDAGTKGPDADAGDVDEDDAGDGGGPDDAGADASDAGADASDAGDTDAGDAGPDGSDGSDGGQDAGDSGSSSAVKPAQGEVVISEVMYDPSASGDTNAEWIELYNTAGSPRLLSGLVLKDGGNRTHTIRPGLVVPPATYVVLVSSEDGAIASKVPAGVIVYDYNTDAATQIQLANGTSGSIVLLDGATEIARAKYGPTVGNGGLGLSSATDQSIQLKTLTYAAAGLKDSWCYSANPWATGSDKGTPGAASDCQ